MGSEHTGPKDSTNPAVVEPSLRQRAEEQARGMGVEDGTALSPEAARQLVHELRVHQIELEMQNEELRRTQEVLEASRARYFDLYDLAPVGYFTLSEQGLILEVNLTATTMLGVPRGALLKQPLTRSIIPEDEDIYYLYRRKLLETGTAQVCELRMARQYARVSQFWARLESILVQDEESGAPVCRVTMSDVTERKGAERAVERLAYDLGERVKELNCLFEISNLVEMPGISLEEVLQGTVDLIPPAWQYPEITCARIILDGQEYSTDSFAQSPWQQAADISVHGEPCGAVQVGYLQERPESDEGPFLKEERSLLNGIAERMGQVTERMRAQQQILQQQQFLGAVLDSLAYPFYVINVENYTVEVANRAAHTGSLRGDLTCFALSHGRDQPCEPADHPCPLQEILITKEPVVVEHVHLTEDGHHQHVEVHGFPMVDSQGNVVKMIEYALDITERKQAEEAIRRSETLLRETGRLAKVGGWELDLGNNQVAWTEEVYRIHEVPLDFQPDLESALSFYAAEDRPILEQAVERAAEAGEPWDLELRFITAKGKQLWVRAIGKAEQDEGRVVRLSGTFQDITERRQAEEALRESEARWRSLTETSPDHILTLDTDLRIQYANYASPGLTANELIGKPLYTLVNEERQAEIKAILEGVVHNGVPAWYETVYHLPDGGDIHYESRVAPRMLADSDKVVGLTLSARDITERKQVERALRDSEEKLRALFEILPVGISVLGEDREIQLANPALGRILHLSQEELQKGDYRKRTYLRADGTEMPPEELPSVRALEEQTLVRDVDIGVLREDGESIWTSVCAAPLLTEDWRVIVTTSDITDRKRAEAALVQARDELEARVEERTAELQDVNRSLRAEIAERQKVEEELRSSEERFRQLAEHIDLVFWITDLADNQILYVSPTYEDLWGQARQTLYEQPASFLEPVHPQDRQRIALALEQGSREEQENELRLERPDGSRVWVRTRVFPVRDEQGQIYRLAGIAEDISEQVQAVHLLERRVEERTHQLSTLLQIARSMTLTLELGQLLEVILDGLGEVVAYDRAIIYQLEGEHLVALAHRGRGSPDESGPRSIQLDDSTLAQRIFADQEPLLISDIGGRTDDALLAPVSDWACCGMATPLGIRQKVVGLMVVYSSQPQSYSWQQTGLLLALANQVAVGIENARLYEDTRDLAAIEERQRLARDLHDAVSQTLFSANIIAEALPRLWDRDPDSVRRRLPQLHRLTSGALAEMRTLLLELRPTALVELELDVLLRHAVDAFSGRSRAVASLMLVGQHPLPKPVQLALYRIAQEALNNVAKHARATEVKVRLQMETDRAELRIRDDGQGFDPDQVPPGCLGLKILRERARAVGATLQVTSRPGDGTEIVAVWTEAL